MRPKVISALLAAGLACGPSADADRRAAGGAGTAAEAARGTAGTGAAEARAGGPARWLFAWAGDVDRGDRDFLAVLDADPASPGYSAVVATVPVDARGSYPHHTEHRLPEDGVLFANGFMAGTTWNPLKLSDSPTHITSSPLLGEHTEEILIGELGLSDDELPVLKAQGVI